jgi:DNA-binding MarR family transcriptional regulator
MSPDEPVDLTHPDQVALAVRVGLAWIEIRRGASMTAVRDHLFGTGEGALEQGQMDTLDLLVMQPSWRMSELADALRVDPSTATRAVQRLISNGLATRTTSPEDGRVVIVAISPAGRVRHQEVDARRAEVMAFVMAAFTAEERPLLADMFERFVAAVDDFIASRPTD